MITGTIKNKVDALWDIFYSGGISNPIEVIEQITFLMFIHDLGKLDDQKKAASELLGTDFKSIFEGHDEYRWSNLVNITDPKRLKSIIENEIFPLIKNLNPSKESAFARYMKNAIFKIESEQKLVSVITAMEQLYQLIDEEGSAFKDNDTRGDVYEYMLGKLAVSGDLGQFRTPRHIIAMMVELVKPTVNDFICDPACGTAGFLIEAGKYLNRVHEKELYDKGNIDHYHTTMFTGYDIDRTMLEIAAMNMMQHNIEDPNINYRNGLTSPEDGVEDEKDKYTIILANPPFKGSLDKDTVAPDLKAVTATTKTELLFVAQFIKLLKIGGRAAVIVPNGVLFGSSKAHLAIRKELIEKQCLQAVISMPSGIFKPYAGVSTAILLFTKTGNGGTDKVWFYDMHADGFSLDDKRQPIEENDISDILTRYENLSEEETRARTEQSFMVPKEEIVENDYDLSINKYKEVVYEQEELPSSAEIMAELCELEEQYRKELGILKQMLESGSK